MNGRAAYINVQGRWPENVNHAPPGQSNASWDLETHLITTTRELTPGEQVFFHYGVGYWVDELFNRDCDKLPKDQRTIIDTMHAVVDNYAWLSHTTRHRRLNQAMRIGMIAFFLAQHCSEVHTTDRSLVLDGVASGTEHNRNPLVQCLSNLRLNLQPIQTLLLRSKASANEVNQASTPSDITSLRQSAHAPASIPISATDVHASDSRVSAPSSADHKSHGGDTEVTGHGYAECTGVTGIPVER